MPAESGTALVVIARLCISQVEDGAASVKSIVLDAHPTNTIAAAIAAKVVIWFLM